MERSEKTKYDQYQDFARLCSEPSSSDTSFLFAEVDIDTSSHHLNALRQSSTAVLSFLAGMKKKETKSTHAGSNLHSLINVMVQCQTVLVTHMTTSHMVLTNLLQRTHEDVIALQHEVEYLRSVKDEKTKQQLAAVNRNLRDVFRDAVRSVCWMIDGKRYTRVVASGKYPIWICYLLDDEFVRGVHRTWVAYANDCLANGKTILVDDFKRALKYVTSICSVASHL